MSDYTAQFYGGQLDGKTVDIPADLHQRGLLYWPTPCEPHGDGLRMRVLAFRFDGTVNEQGYARYRCIS